MKFSCDKAVLLEAVNHAAKAAAPNSVIPALKGILFTVEDNSLTLTGYNLDIGIRTTIPVQDAVDGSAVIETRIADFIKSMPSGNLIIETESNNSVSLKNGIAVMKIMYMNADDYPNVPQSSGEDSFTMSQKTLKSMISQTMYACAVNDAKVVLTGCFFEIKDKVLSVVGMDGLRVAVRQEPLDYKDAKFIVAAKNLEYLVRLLSDNEDDNITICIDNNQVSFELGKLSMIARLISGDYLDFHKYITCNSSNFVEINCSRMIETLGRGMLVINDKVKLPLRCEFSGDALTLSCVTALGSYNDKIDVKYGGEPFTIGLNTKFLLDAFKASDCSEVKLVLTGKSVEPVLIFPKEGKDFTFLIMPMRLK